VQVKRLCILLLMLAVCCLSAPPAHAAKKKVCTPAEKAEADRWLWLSDTDKQLSLRENFPWGEPVERGPSTNERELIQRDYVIGYDADLLVPLWSGERIVATKLKGGRSDCFRADVRLKSSEGSSPTDYKEPVFDQGHMTPSGDVTVSKRAVHNSFIMSNMSPQYCEFNRGIWQILEEQARRWARERGTVYLTNGSIFDRDSDGRRDDDSAASRMRSNNGKIRVAVPTAFYKVIAFERSDGSIETLSILLPHDHTKLDGQQAMDYLQQHVTSLAAIEARTGLDLFPNMPSAPAEATSLWTYAVPTPRSLAARC